MPTNLTIKNKKCKRAAQEARIERFAGTKLHGESGKLRFIHGESTPTKEHPRRAGDFAAYRQFKTASISEPGPENEAAQIRALRFERQSKDAALFREAMAAESFSWGRSR